MNQFTIQQTAKATGVSIATLRYYEQEGIIQDIERLPNGHRRYSEQDVAWIEFLLCLRTGGMPIQEIKRYVMLSNRLGTGSERCALLENHRDALIEKITEFQAQLTVIEEKISWYHEALTAQATVNSQQE